MEKATSQSGGYVGTPVRVVIWGAPRYEIFEERVKDSLGRWRTQHRIAIRGVRTHTLNIDEASVLAQAKLKECKARVRQRDFSALVELLDDYPWLADHPWVANALKRFGGHPRLKRRQGRPRRPTAEPLTVYALVTALLNAHEAQSLEQAYDRLQDWGWMSSAVTAKRLYRRAKREGRHCALLIQTGAEQHFLASEVEAIRKGAQMLKPNETIERVFDDPALGRVEVSIEGKDQVGSTGDFFFLNHLSLAGLEDVLGKGPINEQRKSKVSR